MSGSIQNLARTDETPRPEPRVLRVFISYASEDLDIALAIGNTLQAALGDVFAEINIDKWFLQAGSEFQQQIKKKLDRTDVLIVVYTGAEKESHSYTGWEVGYFEKAIENRTDARIVSLYLERPPAVTASIEGIGLGIDRRKLHLDPAVFDATHEVREDDPMCLFIVSLQEAVDEVRRLNGFSRVHRRLDEQPALCVQAMRAKIFRSLRTTAETVLRPQKQLLFKTTDLSLGATFPELPLDAKLQPLGVGSAMSIFGLADTEITWDNFLRVTAESKYAESWRQAITSVVSSSFPDRINVDNSQIIISTSEDKSYRVILTSCTKYFDDRREFNLYFVEALKRSDFGRDDTTVLLKGLEIVCRFRFMFLESDSQFSGESIAATSVTRLQATAQRLVRELDLIGRDAREAGLDQASVWSKFVDWKHVSKMFSDYEPREVRLREIAAKILASNRDVVLMGKLRQDLSEIVMDIEAKTQPENTLLIRSMSAKLQQLVAHEPPVE